MNKKMNIKVITYISLKSFSFSEINTKFLELVNNIIEYKTFEIIK